MTEIAFSFGSPDDVPAILRLIERAYRGAEAATGWTNEASILIGPRTSAAEIGSLIRDPDTRFVLARDATSLVGTALLQRYRGGAYFGMFAVDPHRQGAGLGKALMQRAEDDARRLWQAKAMKLTVISLRHDLIAWYERRGYVQTGEEEVFPFSPKAGALRTDFLLTVLVKPL